ncbi:MAG: TonB family protein [Candidatus Zixiibacteriota bacterium]|jgi:protein TonB
MKRAFFFSFIFHMVMVGAALISSPFEPSNRIDYGEVIRVSLPSFDQVPNISPPEPLPVEVPMAMAEEEPDIPIESPSTKPAAEIEKPKEKPKPKPEKQTKPTNAKTGNKTQQGAQEGKVETSAKSASGAALSGATVDNASFNYPYWFTQAFNKIAGNFRFSYAYDGTLVCVVYFQVIQSGRLVELKVRQSSGFQEFDDACLAAVERSAPFPPLPRDFREEIIGITLPVKWRPR